MNGSFVSTMKDTTRDDENSLLLPNLNAATLSSKIEDPMAAILSDNVSIFSSPLLYSILFYAMLCYAMRSNISFHLFPDIDCRNPSTPN